MSNGSGRKRKYELKRRAETMEETRRRIAAAAFELHTTVGPAQTTISAIADRAGVQRWTVYRHFPDELSLFRACVAHGSAVMPVPDPEAWRRMEDPEARLRTALLELYAYFRHAEEGWANILRDLPSMPALMEASRPTFDYWAKMREVLSAGWRLRGRRRAMLCAAIGHALDFHAWRQLAREENLDDEQVVELMSGLVVSAAGLARVRPVA